MAGTSTFPLWTSQNYKGNDQANEDQTRIRAHICDHDTCEWSQENGIPVYEIQEALSTSHDVVGARQSVLEREAR